MPYSELRYIYIYKREKFIKLIIINFLGIADRLDSCRIQKKEHCQQTLYTHGYFIGSTQDRVVKSRLCFYLDSSITLTVRWVSWVFCCICKDNKCSLALLHT